MKLIDFNWTPSDRQLRQFAVICLFALPLVGWFWGGGTVVVGVLAGVGLVFAVVGWFLPITIKPVFLVLTMVATPIGIVIGEFTLLLVYFGVFLPIGLCFLIVRRDGLQLKMDRQCKTYWQTKPQPKSAKSYYRQS